MNSASDRISITISGGTCGVLNAVSKDDARSARYCGLSSFHMQVKAALNSSPANGWIACASV